MKIAIIRQRYNPFGGAERFVELALSGLAKNSQVEVTLLTRAWKASARPLFKSTILSPFFLGSTWRDYGFSKAVCRAVQAGEFDLIQAHERVPCCDIFRAGDGLHQRWLVERGKLLSPIRRLCLNLNPYNIYTLAAERCVFRSQRLKMVICISRMVRDEIKAAFDLPDRMLRVIYNGVDLDRFNPSLKMHRQSTRASLGIPSNVPLFLFVGSGFERKGLKIALKALPDDAWLLVVGKDKHLERYRCMGETLGLAKRVIFSGPQAEVDRFYGAADAFVFPTLYEPFGNVVLEAMASGLPVITSSTCGAAELISDGIEGYVLNVSGTPHDWRASMTRLCDPGVSQTMGQAAAEKAGDFGVDGMVDTMIQLYQEIAVTSHVRTQ